MHKREGYHMLTMELFIAIIALCVTCFGTGLAIGLAIKNNRPSKSRKKFEGQMILCYNEI